MLLTLVGLGGAALVLYAYLGRLGYDWRAALFGLALFFSLGGLVFNLRDFYLTDPLALLAIALGFYLLNGGQQNPARPVPVGSLLIVLTVGVLAKETVAALLPLVVFSPALNRRQKLGLALLPLALLVALRLLWPSLNDYSYLGEAQDVLFHQVLGGGVLSLLERVNFALLGTWGPALVLILHRPGESLAYLRARPAQVGYLAIIYSQLLIAHNVDRLLVYGFVVVIPLLSDRARRLWIDRRLNPYGLTAFTLGLQLLYFLRSPAFMEQPAGLRPAGNLAVASGPVKKPRAWVNLVKPGLGSRFLTAFAPLHGV